MSIYMVGHRKVRQTRAYTAPFDDTYEDEDDPVVLDLAVVDTADYTDTGLVSADGEPIYRRRPRIGFIWTDE